MKVKFYNKNLLHSTLSFFSAIGSILGIISLFTADWIYNNRTVISLALLLVTVGYYCARMVWMNKLKKVKLKIRGSNFLIKEGDLFSESGLKTINCNEYFDTIVDNRIIAENSINGRFMSKYLGNDAKKINREITKQLTGRELGAKEGRSRGKKKRYPLGEIVEYDGFLLTSFTKFDDYNRAILSVNDYINFLFKFWDNLDKIYAGRDVVITLFGGSSLTRFVDAQNIDEQDLVEMIIWTFKVSRIQFKNNLKVTLVLSSDSVKIINLYRVKEMYKNGI